MEDQYVPKPDSNMGLAIFTTLCCCQILGIIAIIKASKVNDLYMLKQYQAAQLASQEAKKFCIIGICSGFVVMLIYFGLMLIGALNS